VTNRGVTWAALRARIYRLAIERCRLEPARTIFVDDHLVNVEAARAEGFHALQFTSPERLREALRSLALL